MNKLICLMDFEDMYDEIHIDGDGPSCMKMHERMRQIHEWGHDILYDGDLIDFDELFGIIDLNRLDSQIVIALFRATNHIRAFMCNWSDQYDLATDLFMVRGQHRLAQELMRFANY